MTLIEIVAAVMLIVTSGLILAAVWQADRSQATAPGARTKDREPEYPRAA